MTDRAFDDARVAHFEDRRVENGGRTEEVVQLAEDWHILEVLLIQRLLFEMALESGEYTQQR